MVKSKECKNCGFKSIYLSITEEGKPQCLKCGYSGRSNFIETEVQDV